MVGLVVERFAGHMTTRLELSVIFDGHYYP